MIDKERENIGGLHDAFDGRAFDRSLQMLRRASEVLVVGTRSTAALACHLAFALNKLAIDATRALAVTSETYDRVRRMADTLEYSLDAQPLSRFSEDLLDELNRECASTVEIYGDQLVIGQVYIERSMHPLNLQVE